MVPKDPEVAMKAQKALHRLAPDLKEIAEETGISYASIKAYRSGERTPGRENLEKLAEALERRGVSLIHESLRLREAASDDDGEG